MTVPLLPRPRDPEEDWGQHDPGFFPVNVMDVRRRLALAEYLAPEGIASPWAQLHFINWMLEDQESAPGRKAVEILRIVVLLQFLGYLEARLVQITDSDENLGWLNPLLEKSGGTSGPKSLILWKIRGLGAPWDGQIFAGSHSSTPFFPGAAFYPDMKPDEPDRIPSWCKVRDTLITARGPRAAAPLLDDQGQVADPHLAASLSQYLYHFIRAAPGSGWAIALKRWQEHLDTLAEARGGRVTPVARLSIAIEVASSAGDVSTVHFGSYTEGSLEEVWTCRLCESAGDAWINVPGRQTVTSTNLDVSCSQHGVPIQTGAGEPVGPPHYGAYSAPDGALYVWTDTRPTGSTRTEIRGTLGSDGTVVHWFNRQALEVTGRLISLETVRLKDVAWMSRKEGDEPSPVDIPVSGEYAALVDSCKPDFLRRQWEVKFFGLRRPVLFPYPTPQEKLWNSSTIVVWPPQDCPGWSIDYVAVSTTLAARARFRLIEQQDNGVLVRSSALHPLALYRTQKGKARYFEVGEGLTGESFKSLGLLEIKRPLVRREDLRGRGQLVLDFGTSNSAVLIHLEEADHPRFVSSGVLKETLERSAFYLTFKEEDYNNFLQGVDILSPWNCEQQSQHVRPFLPSLLAKPQPDKQGSEPSIPPRGRGLNLLTSPGAEPRIVSGLKWKNWNALGIQARLKSLIELLLLPAFWELRTNGCGATNLTATYPLAFDSTKKGTYEGVVRQVANRLSERTGLKVEPIVFHSESAAGSNLFLQTAATHVLALDLGGGTTDFAIHVGSAGKDAMGKEIGAILAADSIEYGGRDFLRAAVVAYGPELIHRMLDHVAPDLLPTSLPAPTAAEGLTDQLTDAYVDCLEAFLHQRGLKGFGDLLKSTPQNIAPPAEMYTKYTHAIFRWEALLAGLLFYTRRIVEACVAEVPADKPVNVSFNLLGQGWDLLRLLDQDINNPVKAVLEPRFNAMCAEIARTRSTQLLFSVNTLPTIQDAKTAVVVGAHKLPLGWGAAGGILNPPAHALAADVRKSFVGMAIFDKQGHPFIDQKVRLENFSTRPDWPSDPGYGKLLDELFEVIPEFIPGTQQPLRALVKNRLLTSAEYQRHFGVRDVRMHLIERGQDDLNRGETWPSTSPSPVRSLLAGFLTSVWRPVWASTKL